ncbi:MAG: glycosyltransferase family 4 protein [Gemmatimonadales bacterium]
MTFSDHMRAEYVRNTKGAANVVLIPPFATVPMTNDSVRYFAHARLGFLGRLEQEKGVDLLIDTLPLAADGLGRSITLTIAGRGRQRASLESQSRKLMRSRKDITVQFTDWVTGEALRGFFDNLDLLVIPSTWPEPFALVGLEAAARGVPAVAFSVGGIPDWLSDGFNGHLAPGARPSAIGLSDAVVAALDDQVHHQRLRNAAAEVCSRYTAQLHIARLKDLLGKIVVARDSNGSAS